MRLPPGAALEILLAGAVTTNQLHYESAWSDNPGTADGKQGVTADGTAVVVVPSAGTTGGIRRDLDYFCIFNNDTVAATVTIRQTKSGSTTVTVQKVTMDVGDLLEYTKLGGWRKNNSAGIWGTTATTDSSTADSKAVSAGLRASVADSKAVSSSTVDSTNLSGQNSNNTSQSVLISGASSSIGSNSANISAVNSKDVSQSTLISVEGSNNTSQSVLISALTSRVSSKGG